MSERAFWDWWIAAPYRAKYGPDHPVTMAAREAWEVAKHDASEQPTPAAQDGLGPLDKTRMLSYDAIRYVPGWPETYILEYAAAEVAKERERWAKP